jgi:peroxiredoxin
VQVHRARQEFQAAGARVVLIGQGRARQAARFRRVMALDVPVLADAERESYRAAGARRGSLGDLVGPRSVASGIHHMARSGVVQGRPVGDVTQLGGAMVIRPGGSVAHAHMAQHAGDNAEPAELLAAVAA